MSETKFDRREIYFRGNYEFCEVLEVAADNRQRIKCRRDNGEEFYAFPSMGTWAREDDYEIRWFNQIVRDFENTNLSADVVSAARELLINLQKENTELFEENEQLRHAIMNKPCSGTRLDDNFPEILETARKHRKFWNFMGRYKQHTQYHRTGQQWLEAADAAIAKDQLGSY